MYVFLVVIYGAEFKFMCLKAWKFAIYPFWQGFNVPMGSKGVKKAPQNTKIVKSNTFYPITFYESIRFFWNFAKM